MTTHELLPQLADLATSLLAGPADLHGRFAGLEEALDAGVSGSVGYQLTVVHLGQPVSFSFMRAEQADQVETSLRLPLTLLSPVHEPGSRAVFYSTVPGAFVDLAADLGYVLRPRGTGDAVMIDADLPAKQAGSLVTGLEELRTLHRAAGILIAEGHHPDTVHHTLAAQARSRGVSALHHARRLLGG